MEKNHYKNKQGEFCPYTKDEICSTIDILRPDTILPWCKYFDIPFIEAEWFHYIEACFNYDIPITAKNVFGRYLSLMKLKGWKGYTFKDSDDTTGIIAYQPKIEWEPWTEKTREERSFIDGRKMTYYKHKFAYWGDCGIQVCETLA